MWCLLKHFAAFGLVVSTLCASVWAQRASTSMPETPTLRRQSSLVLVPTLVKTKGGAIVYTLAANDFTVTDNGVPQSIQLEDDTDTQPLALVVAVETGSGGARQLDKYQNLTTILEALIGNVQHRVAVVGFDSTAKVLQDFTPDLSLVGHRLNNLKAGDKGGAILDALAFSVKTLQTQPPEYQRAILLLSETIDHSSQAKLADALRAVSDSNTIIYSIAFSSSRSDIKHEASKLSSVTPGPAKGCMSKDAALELDESRMRQAWDCLALLAPPLRLANMAALLAMDGMRHNAPKTVAQLTGGEYYHFSNVRGLDRALLTISNHVPNRYMLSFHPQTPSPGNHAIEVKLKDYPNLVVTARSSYWANSTAAATSSP